MIRKLKSYHFLWITAIIVIIFGILTLLDDESVIDINVDDTYFVIHNSHLSMFIAMIYVGLGVIYLAFEKMSIGLIKILSIAHISISCLVSIIFLIKTALFYVFNTKTSFPLFDDLSNETVFLTILFLFAFIAQLLFILNILISSIKYAIQRTTRK